jgi:hypothetical protein
LQYGPKPSHQTYEGQSNYPNRQAGTSTTPTTTAHHVPPPYTASDQVYRDVNHNIGVSKANKMASQQRQQNFIHMNQNPTTPPIPPLPKQHSNPFKWKNPELQTSHPLEVNVRYNAKPAPKQTPSPSYDSMQNPFNYSNSASTWKSSPVSENPYKWTNPTSNPSQTKKNSVMIDYNRELSKIKQAIKDNQLPSFQHFNKELNKNKPLSDVRKSMVNNKYLSDVKFVLGESVFYGHKMFLITASSLFYEHFHVNGETDLKITSIDPETFHKIITYCYTDKIEVTQDNVLELALASTTLQVRQVTNICHGFISNMMTTESIFVIFEKALELNNEIFKKKCLDFINKNELQCFASKGFFAVSLPSLMKILEFCNYPREKISEIVEKWTSGSMGIPSVISDEPQDKSAAAKPKKQQQKKKQQPKAQQRSKQQQRAGSIPDLMSLPCPDFHSGPPMVPPFLPFPFPPPPMKYNFTPIRPFAGSASNLSSPKVSGPLINFDDDDDRESIISKDDDAKTKVRINGARYQHVTEFSRLDLTCKRSMLIHEFGFSENLALKCKQARITVFVHEQGKSNEIHNRVITSTKPGKSK